jgi:hypothetical protein
MKTEFRIGFFEAVCVLGAIAMMVAYSISDFHFTLTILAVVVLGLMALIHDGVRAYRDSGSEDTNVHQKRRQTDLPSHQPISTHLAGRESGNPQHLPK